MLPTVFLFFQCLVLHVSVVSFDLPVKLNYIIIAITSGPPLKFLREYLPAMVTAYQYWKNIQAPQSLDICEFPHITYQHHCKALHHVTDALYYFVLTTFLNYLIPTRLSTTCILHFKSRCHIAVCNNLVNHHGSCTS